MQIKYMVCYLVLTILLWLNWRKKLVLKVTLFEAVIPEKIFKALTYLKNHSPLQYWDWQE